LVSRRLRYERRRDVFVSGVIEHAKVVRARGTVISHGCEILAVVSARV
jgi:hypothetical protein